MPAESVGPYRILGRLGAGGMGEVFLAEDPRLGRRVALKTLAPALADRPDARERLRREARAAAAITHPNIAAIFDVFESDAGTHIVMEYVEGTSLDALVRGGPLPMRRVLQIGLELADALDTAHARGVVHRDLKPGNVRLTPEGHVKVLDFGLARTLVPEAGAAPEGAEPTATLTQTGELVGTPAYMAPEQLRGARGDQRSDVYSLGVILFELLTGRRPFSAPTTIELAVETLTRPAPDVRELRPEVPADLAAVVARAMAKSPLDRVPSTHELKTLLEQVYAGQTPTPGPGSEIRTGTTALAVPAAADLPLPSPLRPPPRPTSSVWQRLGDRVGSRWPWAAAVALAAAIVTAVAVWLWDTWSTRSQTPRQSSVVAVLPVEAPSGTPELETAAAGIGEILTANLAVLPGLQVLPRRETVAAFGRDRDLRRLLRDLSPAYVVKAAVRGSPSGLRLDVNLLDDRGGLAWARSYDGRGDDPFALPAQVSSDIGRTMSEAGAVSPRALAAATDRFRRPPTADREVWAYYSDAIRFLDRPDIQGNVSRAITLLEAAVDKDPGFASAWAALGTACAVQYEETRDERWPPRVQQANLEALRLEPDRAETRIALAQMYETTGKYDQAIDELRRAIALAPASDTPHRLLGGIYTDQGRYDEAVGELRAAIDLRPGFWRNWSFLGYAYYQAGRHADAIPVYERLLALQPDSARGHAAFGTLLHEMGRTAEAREQYRKALALDPSVTAWSNLGMLDYFEGRFTDAASAYEEAAALRPKDPFTHRNLGDAYLAMGRRGDATRAYEKALELLQTQLAINPRDADAISTLSIVEAKLGRLAASRRHAAEALALLPNNKDVLYHSAVVATIDGRLDDAADLLTRALALGYDVNTASKDPDLERLRERPDIRAALAERRRLRQGGV